jgi:hypothetical protein
MNRKSFLFRLLIALGFLIGGNSAWAAGSAAGCTSGFEDNPCLGVINSSKVVSAAQVAPQCASTPGWTTTAPAKWDGSYYSTPQCNYQPPPSCPAGYTETSAPFWNGSSWSAPGCQQPITAQDLMNNCAAYSRALTDGLALFAIWGPYQAPAGMYSSNAFANGADYIQYDTYPGQAYATVEMKWWEYDQYAGDSLTMIVGNNAQDQIECFYLTGTATLVGFWYSPYAASGGNGG